MPKIIKKCLVCGKEFKTYRKEQKACSQKCGSILAAKTMKNKGIYKEINKPTLGKTICDYCGKEFKITDARHDKYCSIKCANQSNLKTTQCNRCGKEINYTKNKPEYCSTECKAKDNSKVCPVCGKEFIDLSGAGKIYCSVKCRNKEHLKRKIKNYESVAKNIKRKCKRCGDTFIYNTKDHSYRLYCDSCSEKIRGIRKREQRQRRRARIKNADVEDFTNKEIFERDNWVCQICGKPVNRALNYPNLMSASLDHIIPLAKGGNHTKRNVQLAHFICNSIKGDKRTDQLKLFG